MTEEEFRNEVANVFPKDLLTKEEFETMKSFNNRVEAAKYIESLNKGMGLKSSIWYYDAYENEEY